jgi:hypothetical protein
MVELADVHGLHRCLLALVQLEPVRGEVLERTGGVAFQLGDAGAERGPVQPLY